MTLSPSPPSKPAPSWKATLAAVLENIYHDPEHPVQIALRTYSLSLSFSLGPALLSLIFALTVHSKNFRVRATVFWHALSSELRPTGFASAITTAVGGAAALQRLWDLLERRYTRVHYVNSKLASYQRAFLANVATSTLAVTLLRWRRYRRLGTTLDLSLLLLVRAFDASVQAFLLQKAREAHALPCDGTSSPDKRREDLAKEWQKKAATHLDALVFWASSARFVTVHLNVSTGFVHSLTKRIMWCFFYEPQRYMVPN